MELTTCRSRIQDLDSELAGLRSRIQELEDAKDAKESELAGREFELEALQVVWGVRVCVLCVCVHVCVGGGAS